MPANDHPLLFIHLVICLLQISKVDHSEHFRQVFEEVGKVFTSNFLKNCKSDQMRPLIQYIGRYYTDFLLSASQNKAMHGIAFMQRAALTSSATKSK